MHIILKNCTFFGIYFYYVILNADLFLSSSSRRIPFHTSPFDQWRPGRPQRRFARHDTRTFAAGILCPAVRLTGGARHLQRALPFGQFVEPIITFRLSSHDESRVGRVASRQSIRRKYQVLVLPTSGEGMFDSIIIITCHTSKSNCLILLLLFFTIIIFPPRFIIILLFTYHSFILSVPVFISFDLFSVSLLFTVFFFFE